MNAPRLEMANLRLPIYVAGDSRIERQTPELIEAALVGVQAVTRMMHNPPPVRRVRSYQHDGPYGSVDWFVDRSHTTINGNPQALTTQIAEDLRRDPSQRVAPHGSYLLISRDMTGPDTNFVFGVTSPRTRACVQSAYRFRSALGRGNALCEVTRHTASHEIGHYFGLGMIDGTLRNPEPGDPSHCNSECTLQRGSGRIAEALAAALLSGSKPNAGFCNGCASHMRRI